jgi:parvulin-like peptidyl-prolyl isomerase
MLKELFVILSFLGFSYASHAQVVAKVGSVEITLKEFKAKYDDVRRQTINPPSPEVFLEDLVRFEIGVQEAEKRKLTEDPAVKDRIKQELYKGLLEKEIGAAVEKIKVSEAELRDYYKKNPEVRSSHILIEYKADATEEQRALAKKRAYEIYEEVKKSKRPFEELVRLYSDDGPSKAAGGDIGYQNRITVVPSYYEVLLKLNVNEISQPVPTRFGYHIVKVTGRNSFQNANRPQIRAAVYDEKRKALFDAYFKKLASRYSVTKDQKFIKSMK